MNNPGKIKAWVRRWKEANREKVNAYNRAWRAAQRKAARRLVK